MIKKFWLIRRGFTLMEVLIVLSIIGIIMTIGILPYWEYMKQARLINGVDLVSQEWILAHKEVRNGIIFPDASNLASSTTTISIPKNASILFHFKKWENKIEKYLFAGTSADFGDPFNETLLQDPTKFIKQKEIFLENNIKIQKLWNDTRGDLYYFIEAPFAEGKFYESFPNAQNDNFLKTSTITDPLKTINILVEYDNYSPHTKRWQIFLRPYLQ